MHTIISRNNVNRKPDLPLPFYVRSAGCNHAEPGWRETTPPGWKNFVQIFWTVSGCGEFEFNDTCIRTGQGDFFYRLPGERHNQRNAGDDVWIYRWMTFDGPGAASFINAFGYPRNGLHAGECPQTLFQSLEQLLPLGSPASQRRALVFCTDILARAGGSSDDIPARMDLLTEALETIRNDFADPELSVETLALQLGVHRTTLNRLFLEKLQRTPGDLIREQRLHHALELLKYSSLPIKETAYASGFNDPAYFCRCIRKLTGRTPLKFRDGPVEKTD